MVVEDGSRDPVGVEQSHREHAELLRLPDLLEDSRVVRVVVVRKIQDGRVRRTEMTMNHEFYPRRWLYFLLLLPGSL